MTTEFVDATVAQIDEYMQASWQAFQQYKTLSLKARAQFLEEVAANLDNNRAEIVRIAAAETNLDETRLNGELSRTIFQLKTYGAACAEGAWLDIRIDTGDASRQPPKPDLRKMLVPLGPVVVFGASNFPFAYSTAGGDVACALAAGCSVVLKAHPAHAQTSELVAEAIKKAAAAHQLPETLFIHVHGRGIEVGESLVKHPLTKAVGFTGSFAGGKALFDIANNRPMPIPVFAEMGSVNPIFILPQKLEENPEAIATLCAGSITLGVGQFCTKPGLLICIESEALDQFKTTLGAQIEKTNPATMLHPGIAKSFQKGRQLVLDATEVAVIGTSSKPAAANESIPTVAEVSAEAFLKNPRLHQEVFGPFSLLVTCNDEIQMLAVAQALEGQLTATLMATEAELVTHKNLVEAIWALCGRILFNGVPTGVEPVLAMHHGGPFPATTDSRFTSVGADGIKRFARPLCFQNWPDALLPEPLKNGNPLNVWRTINNSFTKEALA